MATFRREFHTYAIVEAEDEDHVDLIDMSDQIMDNLITIVTYKVSE
jgi:hypothetical protein